MRKTPNRNEYAKEWRMKNPEKVKIASKKYKETHKEELKAKRIYDPVKAKFYRDKNRAFMKEYQHRWWLKKQFNLSPEEYKVLLDKQKGLCAICLKPPDNKRRLAVDHDHVTGNIRGLLCTGCNIYLGQIKDNPEIGKNITKYLIFHSKTK